PSGTIGLLQIDAAGQRLGTIEDADVVQSEKAAREQMFPENILAIHPPGEIDEQLLKDAGQKEAITLPPRARHLVHTPACPGVHRWIDVSEIELISRDLPIGMHVPFAKKELQLMLGKLRINLGKRNHVKRQIPSREPG